LETKPKGTGGSAGRAREEIVAEKRKEQSEDDGQLLQRGEASANCRGSDLADVSRADNAGRTDREAAHHAVQDEFERSMRDARSPRTQDKKNRGDDQHRTSSEFVRQSSSNERSDRAAKKDRRDVKSGAEIGGMKRPIESVHCSIDDTAVETKKKTTERSHR